MHSNKQKPTKFLFSQKRNASWKRGDERGKKVMIKYLQLLREDKNKASKYFTKVTSIANKRSTKAFFEHLCMELSHKLELLSFDSNSINFNFKDWIDNHLEWYYEIYPSVSNGE